MGLPTPVIHELDPADAPAFHAAISDLKRSTKFHASVHVYDEDEYQQMRMFVTDDGQAGLAVKPDGEIVSAFALRDAPAGSVHALLDLAVDNGGTWANSFDTVLPRLYGPHGLKPVARMPFNDDYAPDGWDYTTYQQYNNGRPDVLFYTYDPTYRPPLDSTPPPLGVIVDTWDDGEALAKQPARRAATVHV